MEKYPFHKYADLFPMITEPEVWKAFVDDIRENKVREPVVLYQGEILDGRNRHNAAFEAGVDLPTVTFEGDDNAAIDLVISRNIRRRHLTPSQCSAIAVDLANMKLGDNQHTKNEGIPIGTPSPTSLSEAVNKVPGASHGTAKRLAGVKKEDPSAFDKVKSGELSAGAAEQKVKTEKEERIQARIGTVRTLRRKREELPGDEEFQAFAVTLGVDPPTKSVCEAAVNLGGLGDEELHALFTEYGSGHLFGQIWREHTLKKAKKERIDGFVKLAYLLRTKRAELHDDKEFYAFLKTLPNAPSKTECTALINLGGLDDGALRALLERHGSSKPFAEIWRDYQTRQKSKQRQQEIKSKNKASKGGKVQTTVDPSLTQEDKDKRSFTLFNAKGAWSYAFSVFAEASLNAKKRIVARLATDLGATINFAGELFEPEKVSLNGATEEARQ
jgi:hypothetical protein